MRTIDPLLSETEEKGKNNDIYTCIPFNISDFKKNETSFRFNSIESSHLPLK